MFSVKLLDRLGAGAVWHKYLARSRTKPVPSWSCSQAVSKPVRHIPLLCVQWKTPNDGQRNCPKHVEFYSKNKFKKLMHLVGFIIRIYHDARSPERQVSCMLWSTSGWLLKCAKFQNDRKTLERTGVRPVQDSEYRRLTSWPQLGGCNVVLRRAIFLVFQELTLLTRAFDLCVLSGNKRGSALLVLHHKFWCFADSASQYNLSN